MNVHLLMLAIWLAGFALTGVLGGIFIGITGDVSSVGPVVWISIIWPLALGVGLLVGTAFLPTLLGFWISDRMNRKRRKQ
jgi:hypothetical protein